MSHKTTFKQKKNIKIHENFYINWQIQTHITKNEKIQLKNSKQACKQIINIKLIGTKLIGHITNGIIKIKQIKNDSLF